MKRITPCRFRRLVSGAALALACASVWACPKQPPPGLTAVPVGENLVVNGMPMTVSQVQAKGSTDEVLARVATQWREAGYDVKRNAAAGWDVVAAISKECLSTLQFSRASGQLGYFSVGNSKTKAVSPAATFGLPVPGDVKILSTVESVDSGRKGVTIAMTSNRSLQDMTQYLAEELVRQGWKGVRPFGVIDGKTKKISQRISAQRGQQQAQIVLWSELDTQIVMSLAEGL